MKKKKVVVIGGGTGTIAVLSGLKKFPDLEISVIVSMTDDGGSNAVIRDEFGLLPLSDLRKSIIALSESDNTLLRQLFMYRFDKGAGLSGHTVGNLMMMALADIAGSEKAAVEAASKLFQVRGKVIPVTLDHARLVAEYDDGEQITGEHLIDEPETQHDRRITKLFLEPKVEANQEAVTALQNANYIIAGPGDLYTSTLANIIVGGIAEAIQKSTAKFIFINNLMTKKGQTIGMKAGDLVVEMGRYAGRAPDVVVMHQGEFAAGVLEKYHARGENPIEDDLLDNQSYQVVRANVAHENEIGRDVGDTLVRSLIRHDAEKLAKALIGIMQ